MKPTKNQRNLNIMWACSMRLRHTII